MRYSLKLTSNQLGDDGESGGHSPIPTSKAEKSGAAKLTARTLSKAAPALDGPARPGNTRTRGDGGVGGNEAGENILRSLSYILN